jgi:hypothetical protein
MNSMLYIGMGFILLGFIGLIGIGCLAGLLISIMSDSRGETWAEFKERLPSFLALAAFLVTLGLLEYATVLVMHNYGG